MLAALVLLVDPARATDVLVPDAIPMSLGDFALASRVQKYVVAEVGKGTYEVDTGNEIRRWAGGDADACFDEPACPGNLWDRTDARLAVVMAVGDVDGRTRVVVKFYSPTRTEPVRVLEDSLPRGTETAFAKDLAFTTSEVLGTLPPRQPTAAETPEWTVSAEPVGPSAEEQARINAAAARAAVAEADRIAAEKSGVPSREDAAAAAEASRAATERARAAAELAAEKARVEAARVAAEAARAEAQRLAAEAAAAAREAKAAAERVAASAQEQAAQQAAAERVAKAPVVKAPAVEAPADPAPEEAPAEAVPRPPRPARPERVVAERPERPAPSTGPTHRWVSFELAGGVGLGDTDRGYGAWVAVEPAEEAYASTAASTWEGSGAGAGGGVGGAAWGAVTVTPVAALDLSVAAGVQQGRTYVDAGWECESCDPTSAAVPVSPATTWTLWIQPKLRLLPLPRGRVRPYLVTGVDLSFLRPVGLDADVDFPQSASRAQVGVAAGIGTYVDLTPALSLLVEVPASITLTPQWASYDAPTVDAQPAPLETRGGLLRAFGGLSVGF